MELNKEYKQIALDKNADVSILEGKVVDKIGISVSVENADQNEILITFKDKTFIALGIEETEDGSPMLSNTHVCPPESYNGGRLDHNVYDGKVRFIPLIKNRVNFGLWNVTEEEVQELILKYEQQRDEFYYKQYLRLKKEFEGREEEFKHLNEK